MFRRAGAVTPAGRVVDSPQNAGVKRARALERDRALRERESTYLAWGVHLAQEALLCHAPLRQAYVGPRLVESPTGADLLNDLLAAGVPVVQATTRVLDSIIEGCGDQGILLLAVRPQADLAAILASPRSLILATHGVQDPGNLGSIIRSARALGAGGLVALEGSADPFGSRAVRAAMGAQFTLPAASATTADFLRMAGAAPWQLVAADPEGPLTPIGVDLARPTVLLLGNEGAGLPEEILRAAHRRVRIPMASGVSSLNVHAAAAALLYETARQRGFSFGPP